ncbi:hypothetical protein [Helicobacter rodentium]|nr:hypothetical protein [Helicobacter rodentium]
MIILLQFKIIDCHENFSNFLAMTKNKMLCLHYCGLPRKAKAFLAMTER